MTRIVADSGVRASGLRLDPKDLRQRGGLVLPVVVGVELDQAPHDLAVELLGHLDVDDLGVLRLSQAAALGLCEPTHRLGELLGQLRRAERRLPSSAARRLRSS